MKLKSLKPRLSTPSAYKPKQQWGKGRGGRPWRRLKQSIHERDNWTCCECGRVTHKLECDHIINTAQGGTDDESNLQSLCTDCHKAKTNKESKFMHRNL
ncbi:HNH endonuclease [Acinetobacter pollinis]|uniref:HNH endonuclease n=1 Tax=Acinetobacter pollinis TaxID=2605270 RepID=A0ABU6DNU5_9GAMM|nr:HNH endonuclease [Acinetobacter pollinis]MBF7693458.1 HNH endonuclease [Acinetobacter pollinis]MBF7700970.1 HNH endonuclease [Acinetobacter pollinis]MEB5475524.1 HNH endonuclease [Acinetobacter pollinis]